MNSFRAEVTKAFDWFADNGSGSGGSSSSSSSSPSSKKEEAKEGEEKKAGGENEGGPEKPPEQQEDVGGFKVPKGFQNFYPAGKGSEFSSKKDGKSTILICIFKLLFRC